jgi:epsilon-lactone hydrolase
MSTPMSTLMSTLMSTPKTNSEIGAVRDLLRSRPRPVGWAERRARLDAVGAATPIAADIRLETIDADGVPAEWSLAPGSDPSKVLLFFHGGGYCSGSIASHRGMVTETGRAARVRTLAVGYRLAPEHPFPAALEDALAAYGFLLRQGIAPGEIAIGGDSAGGGLTLATIVRLRDAGQPLPACAWLVSPWVDLQMTGASLADKADVDPLISKPYLEELATAFLAGADPAGPLVSPLHADLAGLPPLLVQVGSAEALLDDALRIARRAGAADVPVSLEIWPHMIHAWHLWAAQLEDGRRAIASAGAFIRARL